MKEFSDFLKFLVSLQLPGIVIGGVVVAAVLFYFPEKIEKWSVLLWRVVYFLCKRGEKKIITHDIQGRVNSYIKSLRKEIPSMNPVGVSIHWVSDGEDFDDFVKGKTLIIRMKHHADQNRNFVYASMVFISKTLLRKAKKYLSKTQRESFDLFVGRKLFEKEKPEIADHFFEEYFSKATSSDKLMELCEKYELIDKTGLFYPVLIQELTFFGEKVFYQARADKMIAEIKGFIDFLYNYSNRVVGDDETPTNFEGAYQRCGIVIIAKRIKRESGKVSPYVNYVEKLVKKRLENIYLIGSAVDENRGFIDTVSSEIQTKFKYYQGAAKVFKAKIKNPIGERIDADNYLILLRSPTSQRVYDAEYQYQYIEGADTVIDASQEGTSPVASS